MVTAVGEYRRRADCRGCGSSEIEVFLDLGPMPLAGGFLREEDLHLDRVYPLDVAFCHRCTLVQVPNVVAPQQLFQDYRYISSVIPPLVAHFQGYARRLAEHLRDVPDPFVVEMGCNDGVLLAPLREMGIRVLGVDPADNVTERARARGVPVISAFFDETVARRILAEHGRPHVITASNVFAHIDDVSEVLRGVTALLAPGGTFSVEVHYVRDLLVGGQFDTIYHEHLCYYSLHALAAMYERHDLVLSDVEHLPMHGGAVRVFAQRRAEATAPSARLQAALREEQAFGVADPTTYRAFGDVVQGRRERIRAVLAQRRASGRTLAGYGAAGRATILLNYCGIDASQMAYIVDASPFRAGWYVPGVHIPVVPPSALAERPTDDCLITAWNYRDEIVGKEQAYLSAGDRAFIIPLPEVEIVEHAG